ncbi:MAG: Gfo/Idh/MocA family oxidoreductase [Elusimicrobia bacterium]|nr:Gfo/Idh/MocA family oxidoreductase [Elusimicrobiota bacterium]
MTRIVVVGCGRWGPLHVRTFNSLPGARVVAAVDTDRERLGRIRQLYPWTRCGTDLARTLGSVKADAAVIATPSSTHFDLVRWSLGRGLHVLCEKPLCLRAAQALELGALARRKRRILMTGHVFLFNPGIVKLKELVDSGELGDIHYLSFTRTNLGPIRGDVNVAYDLASHDVSIANWLLGAEPLKASATGGVYLQEGIHDVFFATLTYPDRKLVHIQGSWLNPKKVRQLTVVGGKKMVSWDDLELNTPLAVYDRGAHVTPEYSSYGEFLRVSMWDADVRLPKVATVEPLKVQNEHFLQAVRAGRLGRCDAGFSAGVVRVLEAINESMAKEGAPVRPA